MPIPPFRSDGYLPEGVHQATVEEVRDRFGTGSLKRQELMRRLDRWLDLSKRVGARRILIDGSFVTTKLQPNDVDIVVYMTLMYRSMLQRGDVAALELERNWTTRQPKELFIVDNSQDWADWIRFFEKANRFAFVRKGLIEVEL